MKIVTVREDGLPRVEDTTYDGEGKLLAYLQGVVGGYVQAVPRLVGVDAVDALCNEDGIQFGLRPNCCGFLGAFAFVGVTGEGWRSLTEAEVSAVLRWVAANRDQIHPVVEGLP